MFAPPWYLRALNVVAALCIDFFVLASGFDRSNKSPLLAVTSGLIALLVLLGGVRTMTSQVTLSDDVIRYRGILRSRTIPVDQVTGMSRATSGLALLAGYVPSLRSKREDGTTITTNLWCFMVSRRAVFGGEATKSASEKLRRALDPFIQLDS